MVLKRLERTLLSQKPSKQSFLVSLYALSALLLVYSLDQQDLLNGLLSATNRQVFEKHEYWRVFTTQLMHADLGHLASNSFFFTGLAYLMSGYYGAWAFPVLSFLAGALINLVVLRFYPPDVGLVGISGVVYFMASFWLTLYFFVQRGLSPARRLTNAVALSLVLLFPELLDERVSYLAHAVGFSLGIPSAGLYFLARRDWVRSHEVWRDVAPDPGAVPDLEWNGQEMGGGQGARFSTQCLCE